MAWESGQVRKGIGCWNLCFSEYQVFSFEIKLKLKLTIFKVFLLKVKFNGQKKFELLPKNFLVFD